jgi:hypothetical protein
MPMLGLGLAGLTGIAVRRARPPRESRERRSPARRDFAGRTRPSRVVAQRVGLYSAYTWTAQPGIRTFADSR